ncbi:MAG: hypothetical protein IH865_11980 [Chloroflexi bacterium]|nr:hypothetical protein [Chloroflexota bacterium]
MRLAISVPDPADVCDGQKCTLDAGQEFTLAVELVSVPVTGYVLAESWVEFGPDLTYNRTKDPANELVWPECSPGLIFRAIPPDMNHVDISCLTGLLGAPPSFYLGTFVELSLSCSVSESSTDVFLFVREEGTAVGPGSVFTAPVGDDGTQIRPEVDGLTVNCLAAQTGTSTPTPTPTPTIDASSTDTPTATATEPPATTPTATQTPTLDPNAPPTWTPEPTWTPSPTGTSEPTATESSTPTPPATPRLQPGDTNCDGSVDPLDAALILQFVARLISGLPCPDGGDPSGDGVVDATDAALILQLSAGLIDALPA